MGQSEIAYRIAQYSTAVTAIEGDDDTKLMDREWIIAVSDLRWAGYGGQQ